MHHISKSNFTKYMPCNNHKNRNTKYFEIFTNIISQSLLKFITKNTFCCCVPCQFACNSAFRNPVLRWESCKGSVWESVKKSSRVCTQQGLTTGSRLASRQMRHTCEACRGAKESRQIEHYRTKLPVWPGS